MTFNFWVNLSFNRRQLTWLCRDILLASCTQEKMMRGNFSLTLSNTALSSLLCGSAASPWGVNKPVRCLTMNLKEKFIHINVTVSHWVWQGNVYVLLLLTFVVILWHGIQREDQGSVPQSSGRCILSCRRERCRPLANKQRTKNWKSFLSGSMLGQRWQAKLRANKIHLQKGICTAVNVFGQSSDATRDLKRFCKWHRKNEMRAVSCGVFLLFTVTYKLLAVMLISHIGNKNL